MAYIRNIADRKKVKTKRSTCSSHKRENGPPAERPFEGRRMEGSFGTGELNDMQEWKVQICKFSRFIPVTG